MTDNQTPNSTLSQPPEQKTVAVFGAGVAGLTVAHELSRLGYSVRMYEANAEAGGFFRSARRPEHGGMPSEYSWHGLGPWYHNVFDIMRQIPFDGTGSVYDKSLSRPINYGIAGDNLRSSFVIDDTFGMFRRFRMTLPDRIRWGWLLLKTWSANRRTHELYARQNAAAAWKPMLSDLGYRTWRATFGPWIGSDWSRVSLHHVGLFFRYNLMPGRTHGHQADNEGPAWEQGPGSGWLLLRGPSNEYWFDKWIVHLKKSGVTFFWEQTLERLTYDGDRITSAALTNGDIVNADIYVLAINPFAAADVVAKTPDLARLDQLNLLQPLIQDGPHTQVSFRIAFSERIEWPKERSALVLADSPFNLTIFPEEKVWDKGVDLGEGVVSLWTGTSCTGVVPGILFGLPVTKCTKEQFEAEVIAQLTRCDMLNVLLRKANNGKSFNDFPVIRFEIWHEWHFSPDGIRPRQPKWVTTTNTQPYLPTQQTPVPNLLLAGAHTKTAADIWSIEGAVESGRRAVHVIEPNVVPIPQHRSWWLKVISVIDDRLFALGAPHVLDLITGVIALTIIGKISKLIKGRQASS